MEQGDPKKAATFNPTGYMCVHEAALHCGWHLPVVSELLGVSNEIGLSPHQVIPNSLENLICFRVLCKYKDIPITFDNFRKLFSITLSKTQQFFYTLVVRQAYTFFEDTISSIGIKWW